MSLAQSTPAEPGAAPGLPTQIVTFRITDRVFGVDVAVVREIKGWQPTTALPDAPAHVLGVINLRGQIVPVHDLGLRLGIVGSGGTGSKVVIVLDVHDQPCGIVADAVSDILDVAPADFRASPVASAGSQSLVSTLVVKNDVVIALLNPETVTGDAPGGLVH